MAIKSYKTNAICPRCGSNLYTQDYVGECPLCCNECDEDMLFIENRLYSVDNPNPVFEVYIPMENVKHLSFDRCFEICPDTTYFEAKKGTNTLKIVFEDYLELINKSEKICLDIRNIGRYVEANKEIDKEFILKNLRELYEHCDKICVDFCSKDGIVFKDVDDWDADMWIDNRRALLAAIEMISI